jgi:hypothetical protein
MIGKCGLCGEAAELQRSHFLPAGFFKAVAQGQAPYDDAPVMMDITKGTAVQSNIQVRKPFLCGLCEQRFSSHGEARVIANCHRKDGEFKLRDSLKVTASSATNSGRSIYYGHAVPTEIDAAAYNYFVLSILWRASATNWPGATGVRSGCLGLNTRRPAACFCSASPTSHKTSPSTSTSISTQNPSLSSRSLRIAVRS